MVVVQMRDVEVVAVAEAVPVQPAVVREREPGPEVGRVDPRVAQNAARGGVDPKTRVSDAGDLHENLSRPLGSAGGAGGRTGPGPVVELNGRSHPGARAGGRRPPGGGAD